MIDLRGDKRTAILFKYIVPMFVSLPLSEILPKLEKKQIRNKIKFDFGQFFLVNGDLQ